MIKDLFKPITEKAFGVIDALVPDKDLATRLKSELSQSILGVLQDELKVSGEVVTTEMKGESWLQRNWRPLTMVTFVSLVVAYWLGFSAPNMPEAVVLSTFGLIKIGLGGYVGGRSLEKISKNLPGIMEAWNKK